MSSENILKENTPYVDADQFRKSNFGLGQKAEWTKNFLRSNGLDDTLSGITYGWK